MTDLALANAVVALAAFVQAAAGIGFAMIAVPLLALVDLSYVPGPSLFAMLGLSLIMTGRGWHDIERLGLAALLPGLAVGTVIGVHLFGMLPPSAMGAIFGSIVLIALALGQAGLVPRRTTPSLAMSGAIAGLMGTVAGIHGPALAVVYQDVAPRTARATIALIFVIAICLSLVSLHLGTLFSQAELLMGFALWPGVLTGYILAICVGHHISDRLAYLHNARSCCIEFAAPDRQKRLASVLTVVSAAARHILGRMTL